MSMLLGLILALGFYENQLWFNCRARFDCWTMLSIIWYSIFMVWIVAWIHLRCRAQWAHSLELWLKGLVRIIRVILLVQLLPRTRGYVSESGSIAPRSFQSFPCQLRQWCTPILLGENELLLWKAKHGGSFGTAKIWQMPRCYRGWPTLMQEQDEWMVVMQGWLKFRVFVGLHLAPERQISCWEAASLAAILPRRKIRAVLKVMR